MPGKLSLDWQNNQGMNQLVHKVAVVVFQP